MKKERLTIKKASEISGIPQQTLRIGLQRGIFPFGVGYKRKEDSNNYVYVLYDNIFYKYYGKKVS